MVGQKLVKESNKIIRKQQSNIQNLPKELTATKLNKGLKRLRDKGFKPFIKGKGSGKIKLGFEE